VFWEDMSMDRWMALTAAFAATAALSACQAPPAEPEAEAPQAEPEAAQEAMAEAAPAAAEPAPEFGHTAEVFFNTTSFSMASTAGLAISSSLRAKS
jgi:hypothetical protein